MNLSHYQSTPTEGQLSQLADLLRPFGVLRFMNWQRTNGSAVAAVGDLPIGISGATGNWSAFSGVPITNCIALANRVGSRPWLCVPHLATAETVKWLIAETLEQAEDAAEKIDVDFEPEEVVIDTAAAVHPDAPLVWPELGTNVAYVFEIGDKNRTAQSFAKAAKITAEALKAFLEL